MLEKLKEAVYKENINLVKHGLVIFTWGNVSAFDRGKKLMVIKPMVLYKNFPGISAVVHTHSEWATSWAQAGKNIPVLGTPHADYFYGDIPCTRKLTKKEIEGYYELETGNVIVETFKKIDPKHIPGVLVHSHGPFTWGISPENAIENAVVLEQIAKVAFNTLLLEKNMEFYRILLDKHFFRKHGEDAYYGQKKIKN